MAWDQVISDPEESHELKIQMQDKDIFTSDELIGAVELDFSELAKFV